MFTITAHPGVNLSLPYLGCQSNHGYQPD